ncbi:MAG: L-histidine N(alpha)-methyltransferase [Bdellovibrionales bacterium]
MISNIAEDIMVRAAGAGRFSLYFLESLPVIFIRKLFDKSINTNEGMPEEHRRLMLDQLKELLRKDAKNVKDGVYPKDLVYNYNVIEHSKRYLNLLLDSVGAATRAASKQHKVFDTSLSEELKELPDYYKRNFHYQTDGYISEQSAELYTHQTEILFIGTLALMRRILVAETIKKIGNQKLRILEVGCGTGELTEVLLKSCPNIEIVAIDLSKAYLKKAQERNLEFPNVQFKAVGGESDLTEFGEFDLAVSGYMFHELPKGIRLEIMKNVNKSLKSDGYFQVIDSLQLEDMPEMDWALKQFPVNFHEPFFANYVQNPLDDMFKDAGFTRTKETVCFMSKSSIGYKS